jgi:hypothetical protein
MALRVRAVPHALRPLLMVAAAVAAIAAIYTGLTLPPRSRPIAAPRDPSIVYGAYHVHSTRSDGTGTIDAIAGAAARAGLEFVVLTDHGDATRAPDPPRYVHGVLCIDAVEISTFDGHLVALGLNDPAPYPLAGDARDVVEDVHRLGARAFAAHPDSRKPELRWRDWDVPIDGLEWINADSEWRDDSATRLFSAALHSIVRPAEAVTSLFERPSRTLERWDAALRRRAATGLAGIDAHASVPWGDAESAHRSAVAWPSYTTMFRTLVQGVALDGPLTRDAARDGPRVVAALAGGRTFSVVRGLAGPADLTFAAIQPSARALMGERLESVGETTFEARVAHPLARLSLILDGRVIAASTSPFAWRTIAQPGAYRIEASLPGARVPWIVSNPIYLGTMPAPQTGAASLPEASVNPAEPITLPIAATAWRVEKDAATTATATAEDVVTRFVYQLGGGTPSGQYAAIATDVASDQSVDQIRFTGIADRPMRVDVQLRLLGGRGVQRWRRSVYLDTTPRVVSIDVADFRPTEATSLQPHAARLRSILFVVDTLNAAPGTSGGLRISAVALRVAR